jgi:pSer/pThr/pTyr-binding forkhead associated (FHA) protein
MDHNSTNGTYVNEVELEPRRDLVDRDVVTVGRHKFMFVCLLDERFSWDEQGQNR